MAKRTEPAAARSRTPVMATSERGATHPKIDVMPPYYLVFSPERWAVVAGKLVPALSKAPLVDGVNGVSVARNGGVRFANAQSRLEQEGRFKIPWDWAPDGESYLQVLDTKPNGVGDPQETWISVFESASLGSASIASNTKSYVAWLGELMAAGKIPACPLHVAEDKLSVSIKALEEARAKAAKLGGHGRASIRVEALEREVAALQAYVDGAAAAADKAQPKRRVMPSVEGGA